jgi:hypothetical protein
MNKRVAICVMGRQTFLVLPPLESGERRLQSHERLATALERGFMLPAYPLFVTRNR